MTRNEEISTIVSRLHEFQTADANERLGRLLLRWIEDPLKPKTPKGRLRINSILVLLILIAAFGVGTFLLFSLVQP